MIYTPTSKPSWNTLVAERLAEFPIYVQTGVARKSPVTRLQRQPGIEVHITHRGRGSFYLNDDVHVHEGRQLVLLSGDCAHQVFADTSSGYERTVVCFDRRVTDWIASNGFRDLERALPHRSEGRILALPAMEWAAVEAAVDRLNYEFTHRRTGWEAATYATLLHLLVALCRHGGDAPARNPESLPNRCIALVHQNLDQDLSLSSLAEMLYISPKHLSRTFSRSVGMTLSHYILHQRIRLAKDILAEHEGLSIYEVAIRCGFKNAAHFSTTFARWTGLTPSAFRNQADHTERNPS